MNCTASPVRSPIHALAPITGQTSHGVGVRKVKSWCFTGSFTSATGRSCPSWHSRLAIRTTTARSPARHSSTVEERPPKQWPSTSNVRSFHFWWVYCMLEIRTSICLFIGKESHRHIIIPVLVGTGTAAVFGVVCLFILKKYRCVKHCGHMRGPHQNATLIFSFLASEGDEYQNSKIRMAGK